MDELLTPTPSMTAKSFIPHDAYGIACVSIAGVFLILALIGLIVLIRKRCPTCLACLFC